MAVGKKYQRSGIGHMMLYAVIGLAQQLRPKLGIRFISVDAYPKSEKFYQKHKFLRNLSDNEKNKETVSMRYDLEPIMPVKDFLNESP